MNKISLKYQKVLRTVFHFHLEFSLQGNTLKKIYSAKNINMNKNICIKIFIFIHRIESTKYLSSTTFGPDSIETIPRPSPPRKELDDERIAPSSEARRGEARRDCRFQALAGHSPCRLLCWRPGDLTRAHDSRRKVSPTRRHSS